MYDSGEGGNVLCGMSRETLRVLRLDASQDEAVKGSPARAAGLGQHRSAGSADEGQASQV